MANDENHEREQSLLRLIQKDNFIGWTFSIDYDNALVMTNDIWKAQAKGIPHNCFLTAASFHPDKFDGIDDVEKEVILLRVIGSTKLPQDDDMIQTKIDAFRQRTGIYESENSEMDDITRNMLQFGGLECRILGTFYMYDGKLWLGSDMESFSTATRLNVYRPHGEALDIIANYIDPIRKADADEKASELGIGRKTEPFPIGEIRYTSTDRLHRKSEDVERVTVTIEPSDFLARRTAVLGMTRTGKSNMIKQLVSVVKRVADDGGIKIGQIIYDINGEYANANEQDEGAIADIYKDTVRYRMIPTVGFEELLTNFYTQVQEGFMIIQRELEDANRVNTDYVRAFVNLSLDEPDEEERSEYYRWQVRLAAYKALLFAAGFDPPDGHKVYFKANEEIRNRVEEYLDQEYPDPARGMTVSQAKDWFLAARKANIEGDEGPLKSSSGKDWVDDTLQNLLDMIAQKRGTGMFISGHRILSDARRYHTATRSEDVSEEIYKHLEEGQIVILDLSVGEARIREKISTQIARTIFNKSMEYFIQGRTPPNIVVYIEEAHNLIGKGMELHETWPRLAKEGAKYQIALVYATQEVSSMHPNILANTENWFITHLNNTREIRELAQFYDFDDFSRSLLRAQDEGFARVKTLSGPFVIPVQIHKFDPERERERVRALAEARGERNA